MLETIAWQRRSEQWLKDGGEFIPHPASWLNGRRWEDRPTVEFANPPPSPARSNPLTDNPPRAKPLFPAKEAACG